MAFRIEIGEPLPRAIRRLALEQLSDADAAATDRQRPLDERVHDVRTAMKKLRALNRLVRPELGREARRADRRLRTIAHSIASLRDAGVVMLTLDREIGTDDEPLRAAMAGLRALLAAHLRARARSYDNQGRARRLQADLARARDRLGDWMPVVDSWRAIDRGLTHGYRRARGAMATAYRSEIGADFHAWRRAVKTHRHQVAALEAIAPRRMRRRLERLDRLGDLLGDEHDLTVLEEAIRAQLSRVPDHRQRDRLLQRIAERRQRLRRRARPLGKQVFAKRPSAFRDRAKRAFRAFRS